MNGRSMTIQSNAGASQVCEEILKLIEEKKNELYYGYEVLEEVIKKCKAIKQAADSGWY